jgi:hypothetical protein
LFGKFPRAKINSAISSLIRLYNIESAFWYPADEILGALCANALCQKKRAQSMRLRTSICAAVLFVLLVSAFSAESQTSPKPLPSFYVQSTMSTPQANSPYPKTWVKGYAVRPDGSSVEIGYVNVAGQQSHIRDIYDVVNNVLTTIEELSKSIQTRAMSESESNLKRVSAAVSCGGAAAGQMLDFDVEYKEEKYSVDYDPNGSVTSIVKYWLAPSLGCFALKKETIWTRDKDGTLIVDTTHQAISVKFQSVDQFFLAPTDYTERSPGETFLELNRLHPNDFPPPGNTAAIDQIYKEAHARLPKL